VPLYCFVCKKCEKMFEAIVPLSDSDKEVKCQYCGKPLKKLITGCAFKVN
jgi:putative FmdB family regulatory protein